MEDLKQKLLSEIEDFRELGHKFLDKKVTSAEFKAVSGGMGVYAQRGGEKFMIRLRIPSGIFEFDYFKLIGSYVEKYNLEYVHFTTRQAVQLHDLEIDTLCDIMEDATAHGLYSRGAGGNFPRNVSLSPLSGVDKEEAFDVTPYAKAAGEYLMDNITKYRLPRKLKVAFSGSCEDTGNATLTDLGFVAVKQGNKRFFKLYIAGGLGNNPKLGFAYDEMIKPSEILYYLEGVIRIFMAEGDYENKGRARLRYVPERMGEKEFLDCYKEHVKKVKETTKLKEIKGTRSSAQQKLDIENSIVNYDEVILQRQKGLYTVELHPSCGIIQRDDYLLLIDTLSKQVKQDIRLTMNESLYIRNLTCPEAKEILKIKDKFNAVHNINKSVTCIGVPICQIGILNSRELLQSILIFLEEKKTPLMYLPSISISGCMNSCARHQVSSLGFAGGKKRIDDQVVEVFELHVGGKVLKNHTKFGKIIGHIKSNEIPNFLDRLGHKLNEKNKEFGLFIEENYEEFDILVKPFLI